MLCFVGNYRCVTVVKNFYTKKDYSIFFEKNKTKKQNKQNRLLLKALSVIQMLTNVNKHKSKHHAKLILWWFNDEIVTWMEDGSPCKNCTEFFPTFFNMG